MRDLHLAGTSNSIISVEQKFDFYVPYQMKGLIVFISILSITMKESAPQNVFGEALQTCCTEPMTGYYRNGKCQTGNDDLGTHVACAVLSKEFLDFTKSKGNDLSTPIPAYDFPGLKPGDKWCLCILRWKEAYEAGVAPALDLKATNKKALEYVSMEILSDFAVD